ncbi:hypothetical protein RB195_002774 [Necator americanus]|uniref:Uncharacterized protein n=1 Tax=Necator americanus TaxID=51031 RepID=A0ABR1DKL8_NECAM
MQFLNVIQTPVLKDTAQCVDLIRLGENLKECGGLPTPLVGGTGQLFSFRRSCVVYLEQYRGLARREEEFDGICMVSKTSNHFQALGDERRQKTSSSKRQANKKSST